jgi:tetratricopeptide (TPR) repeat protein
MFGNPRRIQRNPNKSFFYKPNQANRLTIIGLLALMIFVIPMLLIWQQSTIQLTVLEAFNLAPTPTPFASQRADQGLQLAAQGNYEAAAVFLGEAVQQQPNNLDYMYEYGKMLIEIDRTEESAQLGAQMIELAPNDVRGYALQANSLVWSDPASAIPIALAGTELPQQFAPLHGALAIAYNNIGRYQEALQQGDLAIRIDPLDASVRRAYAYPLIFTGRTNEAVEQLEQAISINPNVTAPYFELAQLYRSLATDEIEGENNIGMALAIYDRLIEQNPLNARAFLRKCETIMSQGFFQEAEPFCDTAIDVNPQFADAYRAQGQVRYSRRNYEGAIESFNQCISLGSQAIECYYIRGLAHYFLGQCDDAWRVLNESLQRVAIDSPTRDPILIGLNNVTVRCVSYIGQSLPTAIPPTTIPPTPIGGF